MMTKKECLNQVEVLANILGLRVNRTEHAFGVYGRNARIIIYKSRVTFSEYGNSYFGEIKNENYKSIADPKERYEYIQHLMLTELVPVSQNKDT